MTRSSRDVYDRHRAMIAASSSAVRYARRPRQSLAALNRPPRCPLRSATSLSRSIMRSRQTKKALTPKLSQPTHAHLFR